MLLEILRVSEVGDAFRAEVLVVTYEMAPAAVSDVAWKRSHAEAYSNIEKCSCLREWLTNSDASGPTWYGHGKKILEQDFNLLDVLGAVGSSASSSLRFR